jgi:hypothetical protein
VFKVIRRERDEESAFADFVIYATALRHDALL